MTLGRGSVKANRPRAVGASGFLGGVAAEDSVPATTWRLAARLARRYPRRSAGIVSLLLLAGFAEGIGLVSLLPVLQMQESGTSPDGIGSIVPRILESIGLPSSLGVLLIVIVGGVALKAALTMWSLAQAGYATADVAADLRLDLIRGLMSARWLHFTDRRLGSLANAVSSEATRAAAFYNAATKMLASVVQIGIYIALTFAVAGLITLAAVGFGLVLYVSLHFLVRMARRAGQQETSGLELLTSRLTDVMGVIKPLKAMGLEPMLQPMLEEETRRLNEAQRQTTLSTASLRAAQEALIAAFVALGLYLFITGFGMQFEEMIFVVYLFYRSVNQLGTLQQQYQKMAGPEWALRSIDRAIRSAQAQREDPSGAVAPALNEAIRLKGLWFSYGDTEVLRDLNLTIPANSLTAVVGPSGSGKTTIADLVIGLHRPDRGTVWVDDVPLPEVDMAAWRQKIGYVPQEAVLFNASLRDNITLGDETISGADVEAALRAADAWDFVAALPEGLDTPVGERGAQLSGGQRQRVAIARAVVRAPSLLILDEATTALDPATERAICRTLARLRRSVTLLAISHQPAIVEVADHVYRLDPRSRGATLVPEQVSPVSSSLPSNEQ